MKEEDYNQFLKTTVEVFETNNDVDFNKEKVWQNIKKENNEKWFNYLKVAVLILLFTSIGFWINYSDMPQIQRMQTNKIAVAPKIDPLENDLDEKPKEIFQQSKNELIVIKVIAKKEQEIPDLDNKEVKIEIPAFEISENTIVKNQVIIEPIKATPAVEYAVQFKRGKPEVKAEEKQDILMISFKKFKKPLLRKDTNRVMATSNSTNSIYKLKF
jgi:hypothetical protein